MTAAIALAVASPALADAAELRVVYRDSSFVQAMMDGAKEQFEAANPGVSIQLEPISASSRDYYTKVSLMNQSDSTAPDIIYEDGFYVTADAAAEYLYPLDEKLAGWADWAKFDGAIKQNGTSFIDGKIYSIPLGTDTQAIWYNKELFAEAGLPTDWQPESWQDILDAAATLKAELPDVTPLNVYVTKASSEATTMRGLYNLLSGTPGGLNGNLMDPADGKWIVGSQGMVDSLAFLKTIYDEGYLPSDSMLQEPNLQNVVVEQMVPKGEIAMFMDGSWNWARWTENGNAPWEGWDEKLGMAKIPTQNGQAPHFTTMSGGWTIAMSPMTEDKDLAFDFLTTVANHKNSLTYSILAGSVGVREDVTADPAFLEANPTAEFFSSLVQYTNFRPALEVYPQVSSLTQEVMEAVTVGGQSPEEAAANYDRQLTRLVGSGNVKEAN
jgi:multiple sugar transport system substrate-binding protein